MVVSKFLNAVNRELINTFNRCGVSLSPLTSHFPWWKSPSPQEINSRVCVYTDLRTRPVNWSKLVKRTGPAHRTWQTPRRGPYCAAHNLRQWTSAIYLFIYLFIHQSRWRVSASASWSRMLHSRAYTTLHCTTCSHFPAWLQCFPCGPFLWEPAWRQKNIKTRRRLAQVLALLCC